MNTRKEITEEKDLRGENKVLAHVLFVAFLKFVCVLISAIIGDSYQDGGESYILSVLYFSIQILVFVLIFFPYIIELKQVKKSYFDKILFCESIFILGFVSSVVSSSCKDGYMGDCNLDKSVLLLLQIISSIFFLIPVFFIKRFYTKKQSARIFAQFCGTFTEFYAFFLFIKLKENLK